MHTTGTFSHYAGQITLSYISSYQDEANLLQQYSGVQQVISRKFMGSKTPYTSRTFVCLDKRPTGWHKEIFGIYFQNNETICFVELDAIDLLVSMKVKWSKRKTSFIHVIWLTNKHVIDISHFFLSAISSSQLIERMVTTPEYYIDILKDHGHYFFTTYHSKPVNLTTVFWGLFRPRRA